MDIIPSPQSTVQSRTTGKLRVWMLTEVSAGRVSAKAGNYQGVVYLLFSNRVMGKL